MYVTDSRQASDRLGKKSSNSGRATITTVNLFKSISNFNVYIEQFQFGDYTDNTNRIVHETNSNAYILPRTRRKLTLIRSA